MKKSFSDIDSTVEAPTDVPESALAVPAEAPQAIVPESFFSNDAIEGEYTSKDIQIPRFQLAQAVGPLSAMLKPGTTEPMFPPGVFVYNREINLGSTVDITLLRLRKYYGEDLPYVENGPKPTILLTESDVRKTGAFMIWERRDMESRGIDVKEMKFFKPLLDATILIKGKPEFESFPFEFEGTPYAKALWTLQSTAYSSVGKALITAAQLGLRAGLHTAPFAVRCARQKIGNNWVWVPSVRQCLKHPAAFADFAKSYV